MSVSNLFDFVLLSVCLSVSCQVDKFEHSDTDNDGDAASEFILTSPSSTEQRTTAMEIETAPSSPIFLIFSLVLIFVVALSMIICFYLYSKLRLLRKKVQYQQTALEDQLQMASVSSDLPSPSSPRMISASEPIPKKLDLNPVDPNRAYPVGGVHSLSASEPAAVIRNGLAVIICIANYDDHPQVTDLVGINMDYFNLSNLFRDLNFTIIPKNRDRSLYWTEKELKSLLVDEIREALLNGKEEVQYDGLIVCISCHGMENAVITSDLRKIDTNDLHRAVSHFDPQIRKIPRIFIIDACSGNRTRRVSCSKDWPQYEGPKLTLFDTKSRNKPNAVGTPTVPNTVSRTALPQISEAEILTKECTDPASLRRIRTSNLNCGQMDMHSNNIWTESTENPDYNLALLYAANMGFQAKCTGHQGSDFIYHFTKKMSRNIEKCGMRTLSDICYEIQQKLVRDGRQLPEFKFNGTSGIVLQKRKKNDDSLFVD